VLVSPKLKLIAIIIYYLMILMIISTWERRSLASFSWKQLVKWLNFGRFTGGSPHFSIPFSQLTKAPLEECFTLDAWREGWEIKVNCMTFTSHS
jgi:hypothetical protein